MSRPLRLVTYLAPSLPARLFRLIARRLGEALGVPTTLRFETRTSGPPRDEPCPFASSEADVAFLCAPSYLWLRARCGPAVDLVPAAFLFADPRAAGRPVYFSDVVVHRDSALTSFADLRGTSWAYNDPCSLSGYYTLLRKLADAGDGVGFFRELRWSGSHLRSMRLVETGAVDAAAIDSNVLARVLASRPEAASRLRVIEAWGPYPIQPVVARASLDPAVKAAIAEALLGLYEDAATRRTLARWGVERFVPVAEAHYESERHAQEACELLARDSAGGLSSMPMGRDPRPRGRVIAGAAASSTSAAASVGVGAAPWSSATAAR